MSASKLVKPTADCKDSFLAALDEFHAESRYMFLTKDKIKDAFPQFIEELNTGKRNLHKPFPDWAEPVPETILWLVKEKEYIGTINIRHRLNWHLEKWGGHIDFIIRPSMRSKGFGRKILQKALPFAAYLGIDHALITVSPKNLSGQHVVEFCGGKLEDETPSTDKFPSRKRYWLDCS